MACGLGLLHKALQLFDLLLPLLLFYLFFDTTNIQIFGELTMDDHRKNRKRFNYFCMIFVTLPYKRKYAFMAKYFTRRLIYSQTDIGL